jgi:hypothetical protein
MRESIERVMEVQDCSKPILLFVLKYLYVPDGFYVDV